jgi:hypothetical protein
MVNPLSHLTEWLCPQRNEDFTSPLLTLDKACPFQELEVLGNGIQGEVKWFGNVKKSPWTFRESDNDGSASGVRDGVENISQIVHIIITP